MKIHVMLLACVAGAAVAPTPKQVFAQQMQMQMETQIQMQMETQIQGQEEVQDLTERERLQQMREHMVDGMRRMAVRMDAVQKRIAAIDRGEPDAAPLPEAMRMGQRMGQGEAMGQGHATGQGQRMGQGQGMKARDGSGPACPNMQPDEDAAAAEHGEH